MMNNKNFIVSLILLIIWLVIIFCFSAQHVEQSSNFSKNITRIVIDTIEEIDPKVEVNSKTLNHYIRKNAHFFLYLILGIMMLNLLTKLINNNFFKSILYSISLCSVYAISDEAHQLFVPGRGGQVKDVIIDIVGSITGILIYTIIYSVINYKKQRFDTGGE